MGRVLGTVGPAAADLLGSRLRLTRGASRRDVHRRRVAQRVLWLFDAEREEGTRLTFQVDSEKTDVGARRSERVFVTDPGFDLRRLAIGATKAERFENPRGYLHFEDLTRDGRYLVFKSRVGQTPVRSGSSVSAFPASVARSVRTVFRVTRHGYRRMAAGSRLRSAACAGTKSSSSRSTGPASGSRYRGRGRWPRSGAATAASCITKARTG